ncbi:MAG: homoserine dehydrogenase [Alphaproteobacteria bacterium]|nr:homoserine dehydrogenase [Alphaproteobacteria bacterium]
MLRVAIAGLGTVGAAVVRQLRANADSIALRTGRPVALTAVSARNKNRSRDCDLSGIEWVDDPCALAERADVDVIVELIGGAEGVARQLAEAALSKGKHFVTANKALIAKHGPALAALAEQSGAQMSFEAAVAGGIPVIKALREGLAGDTVDTVYGILNGTCNYILTRMRAEKLPFSVVLADAQKNGYAEADPSSDIDGHDTANKLAILTSLAFGVAPDISAVRVEGIRNITLADIQFADELGCRIKLLGVARKASDGIEQGVRPTLVPQSSPLAAVEGTFNSVLLQGQRVGTITLEGRGAGGDPTGNAVVADLMDIARGTRTFAFGVPAGRLGLLKPGNPRPICYYMRLQVQDRPGVVADVGGIMRDENLSFASLIQRGHSKMDSVPVVITTHEGDAEAMRRAVEKIARLPAVMEYPCLIPIEDDAP